MNETFHFGDLSVDRILDIEELWFPATHLFDVATREIMAPLSDRLPVGSYDAASGLMRQAFASYLVRGSGVSILVDAGVGCGKERDLEAWDHRDDDTFLRALAQLGCEPDDVDFVIATHVHADHVGWNTRLADGLWTPTFPRARYLIAGAEIDPLREAFVLDRRICRGAFVDSVAPLLDAGVVDSFENGAMVTDGVVLSVRPGHTPGTTVVCLESGDARAFLAGDVIHHEVQLIRPAWSSNFCSDPVASANVRRALLTEVAHTESLLMPAHFPPCRLRPRHNEFELLPP